MYFLLIPHLSSCLLISLSKAVAIIFFVPRRAKSQVKFILPKFETKVGTGGKRQKT